MLAKWLEPSLELARGELAEFHWLEEPRPEEFSLLRLESEKGVFQLRSQGWVEAGRRLNVRYTRLQGKALDIATLICYPTNRPDLLPVYAYEWVVVGGRGHAMICDVEVCGRQEKLQDTLQLAFRDTAKHFNTVFEKKEAPEWFQEIAQPHAQFFPPSSTIWRLCFDCKRPIFA